MNPHQEFFKNKPTQIIFNPFYKGNFDAVIAKGIL